MKRAICDRRRDVTLPPDLLFTYPGQYPSNRTHSLCLGFSFYLLFSYAQPTFLSIFSFLVFIVLHNCEDCFQNLSESFHSIPHHIPMLFMESMSSFFV